MPYKHTPGYWAVKPDEGDASISKMLFVASGDRELALVLDYDCQEAAEVVANARLMAAAPELLAACLDIVARNEIQNWFNVDKCRAAIAKATS